MVTINELTGKKEPYYDLMRGIVYSDNNYVEFGYFPYGKGMAKTIFDGTCYYDIRKNPNMKKEFSLLEGRFLNFDKNSPEIAYHKNVFGNGAFPYSIDREYGAEKHIDIFEDSVELSNKIKNPFYKELKYSFGIEFETAAGYVPEEECFRLGLIPLRDGSISGIEYSTIPMQGNEGLNLLKEQMETLKKYTYSNKECSVHIHLGGYPVQAKAIFILHSLWNHVQQKIMPYIPSWSYNTNYFKKNEKSYCNKVHDFTDFKDLYKYYVGQSYLGDLYQPHPNDIRKEAKWNIKTRYFNCNLINMLCYNSAKTVEFRFLTPTYSYEKLTTFLFILNGILKYAELLYSKWKCRTETSILTELVRLNRIKDLEIIAILKAVYSKELIDWIEPNLMKLSWMIQTQTNVGDFHGGRLDIENRYFPDGKQEN